jgi:hypothetical protein
MVQPIHDIMVGILVNTDPSILNVKLEQGFEIKNVPYGEIIEVLQY